ncbi:hypothetical protein DSL72_007100 [Monilinia vaccinii-corymbosi]|uniref:Uncharacterized protein n=1 Tax=Monilinia vaccinii-corymbosi TaxID=61207 RepID=A0A8A3PKW3_9HELO|nr:hypothetical protein DSL72_007100 [Monilinia vaccinii-corymbosi]
MSPIHIFRLAHMARMANPSPMAICMHIRVHPSTRRHRPFSHASPLCFPRKDAQDRNSIDTEATEYSKSGGDDAAAREARAAFDPGITRPEGEGEVAGRGKGRGEGKEKEGNPLDVSPANQEVSRATREGEEAGARGSAGDKGGSGSGFGKPEKRG